MHCFSPSERRNFILPKRVKTKGRRLWIPHRDQIGCRFYFPTLQAPCTSFHLCTLSQPLHSFRGSFWHNGKTDGHLERAIYANRGITVDLKEQYKVELLKRSHTRINICFIHCQFCKICTAWEIQGRVGRRTKVCMQELCSGLFLW